jgi:hypothetical protein
MVRAVSRWPFTAEAQFRVRVIPCGIFGRRNGTGTSFSPRFSVFPCEYHYTTALHTHVLCGVHLIVILLSPLSFEWLLFNGLPNKILFAVFGLPHHL